MSNQNDNDVLILGVYLLNTTNHANEISRTLQQANEWNVDLRWAAVGSGDPPDELTGITVSTQEERAPKFRLINALIEEVDIERYRYLIVADDDIELPRGFVDRYLRLQEKYGFALAQPACTHDSYIDHHFVAQLEGVEARWTRFVEIGPLVSIRRDIFSLLLPFDEKKAPMGRGLDFVWPTQLEAEGVRLGIVDATPVKHALRKPVALNSYDDTKNEMDNFLSNQKHLSTSEAFLALETYPLTND